MRQRIPLRGALLVGLALMIAVTAGCAALGVSRADEIRMGQETAAEIERRYRTYEDPQVTRLGQQMAAVSARPDYPYRFRVIEMDEVNAFALPGGPVYITTGMLAFTRNNPDQLAAVIAHEVAHVAERHTVDQLQQGAWLGLGIEILTGGGTTRDIAIIAANLQQLGFSRNQERDADTQGAVYLARAGMDPSAMVRMLTRLGAQSGGSGIAFLQTHPPASDRVSRVQAQIQSGEIARMARQSR